MSELIANWVSEKIKVEPTETRSKFKSYEEIKKEMEELNLNVKTDYEMMRELISKLNQSEKLDKPAKLNILKDLEFFVHQVRWFFRKKLNIMIKYTVFCIFKYDNGLLLCDMGGFNAILVDMNKTEDVETNIENILVLGAAIQRSVIDRYQNS